MSKPFKAGDRHVAEENGKDVEYVVTSAAAGTPAGQFMVFFQRVPKFEPGYYRLKAMTMKADARWASDEAALQRRADAAGWRVDEYERVTVTPTEGD